MRKAIQFAPLASFAAFGTMFVVGLAVMAFGPSPVAPAAEPCVAVVTTVEPETQPIAEVDTTQADIERAVLAVWSRGKRSGELTALLARRIAAGVVDCPDMEDFGSWEMTSLAWWESSFMPSEVSPSGRHFGLYQVAAEPHPHHVERASKEACGRLMWWRDFCLAFHSDGHDWLAHWFAGVKVNKRAALSAAKVRKRVKLLRDAVEG